MELLDYLSFARLRFCRSDVAFELQRIVMGVVPSFAVSLLPCLGLRGQSLRSGAARPFGRTKSALIWEGLGNGFQAGGLDCSGNPARVSSFKRNCASVHPTTAVSKPKTMLVQSHPFTY